MNSVNKLIYDVNGPHEESPHGVCSSDSFYKDPEVDHVYPPSNYTSVTPWGAIYEGAKGNTATNVRVEVRNLQLWVFSKSRQTWSSISSTPQLRLSNPYPDGDMFNVTVQVPPAWLGGIQGPVVKSWCRASRRLMPWAAAVWM